MEGWRMHSKLNQPCLNICSKYCLLNMGHTALALIPLFALMVPANMFVLQKWHLVFLASEIKLFYEIKNVHFANYVQAKLEIIFIRSCTLILGCPVSITICKILAHHFTGQYLGHPAHRRVS